MMEKKEGITKTLGEAIDEIVQALQPLDQSSRVTAIKAACEHLHISLIEKQQEERFNETVHRPVTPTISKPVDIKSLKELKRPASANEMAAVVAFYLSELASEQDRKTEVEIEDIVKYFKQAGFPLPKAPQVLLQNAKNAGYFDSVGSGKYKLNPVGYNLVVHNLPRSQPETITKSKRSKKKLSKRKSTNKVKK